MSNLLSELNELIKGLDLHVVTGVHGADLFDIPDKNAYAVLIPMDYTLNEYADDAPCEELQEVRISLFHRDDFMKIMRRLTVALLEAGLNITDRRYIGWERGERYHHYVIDVSKSYNFILEDEKWQE
jgi:hypothetical protein